MELVAIVFGISLLFDLVPYVSGFFWRNRRWLAILAMLSTAMMTTTVLAWHVDLWTVLFAVASLYRVVNNLRTLKARMHEAYLKMTTLRTTAILAILQLGVAWLGFAWVEWHDSGRLAWGLIAGTQLVAALALFVSSHRSFKRTRWPQQTQSLSDNQLPTITVAIPARNETDDLKACLESLVLCDYPKLEILVLDDCSQSKRTPEIIHDFAQDGVRFIQGKEPRKTWLPKNQAYEHLAKEASGEWILFAGVDVRFGRQSLRNIVSVAMHKKKLMMSLLPWRALQAERRFAIVQGLRYAWELVPPRRLFNRPPVLSTCWIIQREALQRSGGFAAVSRSIVPEAYFAKKLVKNDAYSFLRCDRNLGVESIKPANEQLRTALRMRYPQMHRRPENAFLLTHVYGFFLIFPFILVPCGFWIAIGPGAHVTATVTAIILVITYIRISQTTRTGSWWFGVLALPFGLIYDIALLHVSMYRYEFSTVDWQGRNICIPTMHVTPRLPPIGQEHQTKEENPLTLLYRGRR